MGKQPERLMVRDPASWERVTAEAKAQASAELIALTQAPLEPGSVIAWAYTRIVGTATDSFSSVHRVGTPKGNVAYTACGEPIPDPALWMPLSAALAKAMAPCGFCKAAMAETSMRIAA